MKRTIAILGAVWACWLVGGCRTEPTGTLVDELGELDYNRPLPPGALALRKLTDPADIPDFTAACRNRADLREAIARSLNYLSKPSSEGYFPYGDITHQRMVASLQAFDALLAQNLPAETTNSAIRRQFDVYTSVGCDGKGTVLFTGYYTPIFNASPTRSERFRYPLYKQPADLVKDDQGKILGQRTADGGLRTYPDRRQIETAGMLVGQELVWMADPFEAYIAHVQGSAVLRMPDGNMVTVGYAASNGHDYKSVAKALVADGKIAQKDISLQAMIDYFHANPGLIRQYTHRNPRFVFFRLADRRPVGCLNEEVTAMRSIATDKEIYPRAGLAFFNVELPQRIGGRIIDHPYSGFALDQDAGGAIRAPGRCDIYRGLGDEAGLLAGRTQQPGRLYYLFVKE